jgi:hydroxypyruvate reductase
MADVFLRRMAGRVRAGIVVGTHRAIELPPPIEWVEAGHPVPDTESVRAGLLALRTAAAVEPDESLVVLLSGGASALLAVPQAGLGLDDKQEVTGILLGAGADIHALNAVRKHLSRIKGGWLAAASAGPTLALAVSDVIGDDLSVIGSGPTVPDPSTFDDALAAADRLGVWARLPVAARRLLECGRRGEVPETPKPGDPRLDGSVARVIGSRRDALDGARAEAEALGYPVFVDGLPVTGEAREAGPRFVRRAADRARGSAPPLCILSAGETTVRVVGGGRGGRNQELALATAGLIGCLGREAVLASFGTDGVDGPTDAAGALVDTTTLERARTAGLPRVDDVLAENDAYSFFRPLGDLLVTGPTDTNVGDVQVLLIGA